MTTKKERLEAIIRRLEEKNTDNKLDQEIADLKKEVEDWEGIKELPEKINQSTESNKFTCHICTGETELAKLARTTELTNGEILRSCQRCYEILQTPLPEEKIKFTCDSCRYKIFGVCDRRRVSVSMPNSLGFIKGKTYNLCKSCTRKVGYYGELDDIERGIEIDYDDR